MYCGSSDNVRAQRLLARPLRDQPGGQEASVAAARCLPLRSSRGFPGASCGVPRESAAKNPLRRNEMKYAYGLALVAALVFGCSSSSKSTRTSSTEGKAGTVETTGSTAGTQANAQGTATTSTASSANNNTGTDTNAQGSASGSMNNQPSSGAATASNQGDTSSAYGTPSDSSSQTSNTGATGTGTGAASTPDQSGSSQSAVTSGPAANTGAASSQTDTGSSSKKDSTGTYSQSGQSSDQSSGAVGSTGPGATAGTSSDQGSLRTVTGSVARVDQNSITLDQAAGGVTLTVDSQTQVLRRGQPVAAGISAIREGTQVRASFDPASNRADKIEVMGRARKHSKGSSTSSGTTEQGKANSGDQTTTPTPSSNPK